MAGLIEIDNTLPIVDENQIETLLELDDEDEPEERFIFEAAEMYDESAQQHFGEMERLAVAQAGESEEDMKARLHKFSRSAHAMKGTAGNMGGKRLSKIFEHLQRSGEQAQQERCAHGVVLAKQEHEIFRAALKERMAQL
uniref:HPt domain-containing protein n=1 Tax=Palpitomonas bilix TaxID=652834 RepID=A0A7S3GDD4_9EUKA|mmetsp:Transcript_44534/g.115811  ORF Transcript_44534/g.115811 Transcript_44534/m.115811 type:complete len:140 (+) Transcript_44534:90-509(+)|eukprot:CAMPEP_0113886170 /NCGR_PEP_ID=MMETSP0780_2-20120614/11383_1 /TAXON_ID=652834 /ORGANISM="Palpitomonas bilix" /LENGTH=139 /DNA_ID=CAMNT_0000874309 /DNA_START=42 /DNA_END=461 /DNA_ORIENTATION=- /assembly_acc=CAM_ASM_000599